MGRPGQKKGGRITECCQYCGTALYSYDSRLLKRCQACERKYGFPAGKSGLHSSSKLDWDPRNCKVCDKIFHYIGDECCKKCRERMK